MNLNQIEPHLWWWTAPHTEWTPRSFRDGQGWQQEVSSYALVENDDLVLFDPLVPVGEEKEFWKALDGDVEHHGPPAILVTIYWHARSSQEILDRYPGSTLWAHSPAVGAVGKRVRYTNTFEEGDTLPGSVEALAMHSMNEAAFWLPRHRALVVGDSVLGYDGRAEPCPASWLRKSESVEELRASIRRALERAPERLLLTHAGRPTRANWRCDVGASGGRVRPPLSGQSRSPIRYAVTAASTS
jgi:glyoxylase-like metal-dependent hydrolase (beta-lactamase superfamily II)